MKDEDGIIPDDEYIEDNEVHNPTAYMNAMQDVKRMLEEDERKRKLERLKNELKYLNSKSIGLFWWLVILAFGCVMAYGVFY